MEKGTHGHPVETITINDTEVHVAQLNTGAEYFIPGLFDGSRHANNVDQAKEWAKDDVETGGEAHAWRENDEGGAGWKHKLKQLAALGKHEDVVKHLGI